MKPALKRESVFGGMVFVHMQKPKSKVYSKAELAVFLVCDDIDVHTVNCISGRKIIKSVHLKFEESSNPGLESVYPSSCGYKASS